WYRYFLAAPNDPRGGVRHVIPGRANYLARDAGAKKKLVTGGDDPLLPHIIDHLARATQVDIVVSFALESGVDRIFEHLRDLLDRGGKLRILTGDYLGITDPQALIRLLDLRLRGDVGLRIFETGTAGCDGEPPIVQSF